MARKKGSTKNKVFIREVKYHYPNGDLYDGTSIGFFITNFIFWILHIISSPFTFKQSVYCGKREVYWREKK